MKSSLFPHFLIKYSLKWSKFVKYVFKAALRLWGLAGLLVGLELESDFSITYIYKNSNIHAVHTYATVDVILIINRIANNIRASVVCTEAPLLAYAVAAR